MNLRRTANKLQTALCAKGVQIRINQFQSYSEKAERMVTKYVLQQPIVTETGRKRTITIFESYQIAEVVKYLARLYEQVNTEAESVC